MKTIKTNRTKLNRMLNYCEKIKQLQQELKPVNYRYNSVQTYIVDRVETVELQIKSVMCFEKD